MGQYFSTTKRRDDPETIPVDSWKEAFWRWWQTSYCARCGRTMRNNVSTLCFFCQYGYELKSVTGPTFSKENT